MNKHLVRHDWIRVDTLIEEVQLGSIKIPAFSSDLTWDEDKILLLFDSISKGIPIGRLVFWEPQSETIPDLEYKSIIGGHLITGVRKKFKYLIDGTQRVHTLFKYLNITKTNKDPIHYHLIDKAFTFERPKENNNFYYVPFSAIVNTFDSLEWCNMVDREIDSKNHRDVLKDSLQAVSKSFYECIVWYSDLLGGDYEMVAELVARCHY